MEQIFPGKSEMAYRLRELDWSQSTLGPVENWPQSLKTVLGICLTSKFPTCVWWGKNFSVFYNDDYIPIASKKHPQFIGKSAKEQWSEIWHALQPITDKVFSTGEAYWAEGMQFFMSRKDFLEETYFTFSYTPIWDESGKISGVIIPCQEKTEQIISERRFNILKNLGTLNVSNATELAQKTIQILKTNLNDIPIAQFYLINKESYPHLIEGYGWSEDNMADPIWPFNEVIQTKLPKQVTNLRKLFPHAIPTLPYEEGPDSIYMLPLNISSSESLSGVLVLGVSARLAFEKSYENFFALIGKHVSSHLSNVFALEKERLMMALINEKLKNLNRELEEKVNRRTEELVQEKIKLEKTNEELNQYATIAAHDLRAPVRTIQSWIELLSLSLAPQREKEVQDAIRFIQQSAIKLDSLIVDLLKVARVGTTSLENTELNLNQVLESVKKNRFAEIERTQAKIHWNALPIVIGNSTLLEALFSNLIGNAINYRELTRIPDIVIDCKETEKYFEFSVKDNGIGIEEAYVNRVFEMFKRLHSDHDRPGTGVGLSYCKKIVEGYGGTIWIKSVINSGTTIYFTYPKNLTTRSQT